MRKVSLHLHYVTLLGTIILSLAVPLIAGAQADPPTTLIPSPNDPNPAARTLQTFCNFETGKIHYQCIPEYISYVIKFIFGLTGAACLLMIIISGFQVTLAKAVGKDRNEGLTRLRVAVIGFILCGLSWFILDFIITSIAGI